VVWLVAFANLLPSYLLLSFLVVAYEKSSRYVEAAIVTGVAVVVLALVVILPGSRPFRLGQEWTNCRQVDHATALEETYRWTRAAGVRGMWCRFGAYCCCRLSV